MNRGDAGDSGDHYAGKKLHGGDIALVERAGGRRQHFEDAQRAAVVAQRRDEDRADSEAAATGEVDLGIAFGVVAQHDFAGADGFGGDAGVGLQADAEIGCGATSAGAADDFVPGAECDGGSGGSGQMLGAFGDGADRRLKIEFGRTRSLLSIGADARRGIPMRDARHWRRAAGCADERGPKL